MGGHFASCPLVSTYIAAVICRRGVQDHGLWYEREAFDRDIWDIDAGHACIHICYKNRSSPPHYSGTLPDTIPRGLELPPFLVLVQPPPLPFFHRSLHPLRSSARKPFAIGLHHFRRIGPSSSAQKNGVNSCEYYRITRSHFRVADVPLSSGHNLSKAWGLTNKRDPDLTPTSSNTYSNLTMVLVRSLSENRLSPTGPNSPSMFGSKTLTMNSSFSPVSSSTPVIVTKHCIPPGPGTKVDP
jgi:hypothetical protein